MGKLITGALVGVLALMTAGAAAATAHPRGPNGQVVFGRFDPLLEDTTIYTVNPNGSHARQVLALPAACPRWSPDGTRIITCGFSPHGAAALIDPDDGSYRVLPMPDPELFTACPLMTPDGARLTCEGFGEDEFENPTDPSRNGIYTIRRRRERRVGWNQQGSPTLRGRLVSCFVRAPSLLSARPRT